MHDERKLERTLIVGTLLAACGVAASLRAEDASIVYLIDFEEHEEETAITSQYQELGVAFSILGEPTLAPVIAVEGAPTVAFNGSGADSPMSSGAAGLTDPIIDGEEFAPNDIVLTFDPPVTGVKFFVIDLDAGDSGRAHASFEGVEVDSDLHAAGSPGTGNGVSTLFTLAAEAIDTVVIGVDNSGGQVGWAIDFLSFTRPCSGSTCGPRVRVSQESAPGAGDFADNVLGEIQVFPFFGSPGGFYAYNVPAGDSWNGLALDPVSNRSHLLVGDSSEGLTLYIVHDRPSDGSGGDAETIVEVFDDSDGAQRAVEDDPATEGADLYTGEPGDTVFTSAHSWSSCCTDGFAISGLDCAWSATVAFSDVDGNPATPTIQNIEEWVVYSASGAEIPLALEPDRRALLEYIPGGSCPPDMNFDGVVGVSDLLQLLAAWGPCDPVCSFCPPDFDLDGSVAVSDLLDLLGAWGACE